MLVPRNLVLENEDDGPVLSLAFSPEDPLLATGDAHGHLKLWNVLTGQLSDSSRCHDRAVWSVAFSPDGRMLASGGLDGEIHLWELNDLRLRKSI